MTVSSRVVPVFEGGERVGQALEHGHEFAGYRIEKLLGAGGMGEVYLARDRDLPRWVALKLLGGAVTHDPGVRSRFQREADTAARLAHPNIVSVHARGEHAGQLWIAMEYIDGTDVGALLQNGPLPPELAVWIIGEAARALDHAHQHNILHRDVKPANILLTRGSHERVLLADFGIAKALDESVGITRTGEVYASFRYAAPEQFDPTSGVDRRADVYALGGTFYHLLTGAYPFPATTSAQLIHSHLNLPAPRPSAQNPALPAGFDAVIARAMAKNREERFGSCGELAAAAADVLYRSGTPAVGNPVPAAPSAPRRSHGKKVALIAVTAVAVLALLGAAGAAVVVATGSARDARQQLSSQQDLHQVVETRACEIGGLLLSMEYQDADAAMQKIIDSSTGSVRKEYEDQRSVLVDLMQESKVNSQASDLECYFKSGDDRRAEVLVTGTQTTSNAGTAQPTKKQLTMMLTLENIDGLWLCSKVEMRGAA